MADVAITDSDGTVRLHGNMSGGVMRWQAFKTITAAEWNAGVSGGTVDVVTLPTGAILYDATVRFSDDFNDSYGTAGGDFSWDRAGTVRPFSGGMTMVAVDDWAGVSGSITTGARNALGVEATATAYYYGPPAFIKDAATAGPLQFAPNANGDATQGTVTFWLYTDATPVAP